MYSFDRHKDLLGLQVNIYMGLALLSMPYAMREAGWVGAAALAGAVALFCLSAKLLTAGFKTLGAGVPQTYPNLGIIASIIPAQSSQIFLWSFHSGVGLLEEYKD